MNTITFFEIDTSWSAAHCREIWGDGVADLILSYAGKAFEYGGSNRHIDIYRPLPALPANCEEIRDSLEPSTSPNQADA